MSAIFDYAIKQTNTVVGTCSCCLMALLLLRPFRNKDKYRRYFRVSKVRDMPCIGNDCFDEVEVSFLPLERTFVGLYV